MDLANVHKILPNPITVTLTPQNPTAAAVQVAEGHTRPLKQNQLRMMGELFGMEETFRAFLLPTANLGGTAPKNGDKLADNASVNWTVKMADLELEGNIYRLLCMKQVA